MNTDNNPFRQLPSVDILLQAAQEEIAVWGRPRVTSTLRHLLEECRAAIAAGAKVDVSDAAILTGLRNTLAADAGSGLVTVLNLTGTVLHTNLGRAVLPAEALQAIVSVASGASNLEFDVEAGERGDRDSHVEALVCELTGAEAATVVNNNAAAVLLVLNTLAQGREVPVSRGELVEIGGSFRIPEVMERSGCQLVEIGATNRTHVKDYRNAINADTALLLKVHCSNYQIQGFTQAVTEQELATLAKEHELPFVIDLGSGNLVDFSALGLPAEPTAAQSIAAGADVVTFSGDKLLGGPQAGLIAGRRDLIASIRKNPLKRALRPDKMTLAGLAEVLRLYRNPDALAQRLPTLRYLTRNPSDIEAQANTLLAAMQEKLGASYTVSVKRCHSQIGSGALPVETLPSAALHITSGNDESDVRKLAAALRKLPLPVIGRIQKNALWLDMRCLETAQEAVFVEQLADLSL